MRIIDISGFGHSGKTAVSDLLREFKNYDVSHPNFEFNLLRVQGGLLDLKNALVDNWSPIRSDASIRRFKKLIKKIGPKASIFSPKTLFYSNGMNYDSFFNEKFSKISLKYIDSLYDYKYKGEWPYISIDESIIYLFIKRLINYIFRIKIKHSIYVTSGDDFMLKTKNYLDELFINFSDKKSENIVLHNAFEPFNSILSANFFKKSKSIVVIRDPRDIYCSTLMKNENIFQPDFDLNDHHSKLKKDFLHSENINNFIKRQKIILNKFNPVNNKNLLIINYESLIKDYENQLKIIYKFLDEKPENHVLKKKFFNPKNSVSNIDLWKKFHDQDSVFMIKNELKLYYKFKS